MDVKNNVKNILIVDDDADMCDELKEALHQNNFAITLANTAAEAREELLKTEFDLAILDVYLPDSTGIELAKKIREDNSTTSILMITGYASLDSCLDAWDAGALKFIQKPLDPAKLKSAVNEALRIRDEEERRIRRERKLEKQGLTDFLTGLYNKRYFNDWLATEIRSAKRYGYSFSLAMADIDFFKSVNDVYGHISGDILLKSFAEFLKNHIRESDVLARYGGEEFLILLNRTNKNGSLAFAEHLRASVEANFFSARGKKLKLTVSIGVSSFPEDGLTAKNLMDASDWALDKAKIAGRNRVASAGGIAGQASERIGKDAPEPGADEMRGKLSDIVKRANKTVLESVRAFAREVDMRDHYYDGHLDEIAATAGMIGDKLSLSDREIDNIRIAAALRDLGKVSLPDHILDKRGKLTKSEEDLMKMHPLMGADIVNFIPRFKDIAPLILFHHEMFNGQGYCNGLKGKEIPVGARVVAVADAYHALISDRPYRKAYTREEAIHIVKKDSGKRFDPQVVGAMVETLRSEGSTDEKRAGN
ncbi:MAG: diguanylate cyclase [Candidatus Krumholzibacteriota bacterium]|nr:diguanylate cyclase [Candidatus Krumholzibacteriota bacterium]